jgi:serine carboxypeptidase-like clade 2
MSNSPNGLFSGYVTVDQSAGRALFYFFVPIVSGDPATAPLLLWLNGGPGCSSIGGGLMTELGPWYPTSATAPTLTPNPYTWAKVANVLFLESPACVGFSYSNTSSDCLTAGDARSAADIYTFLQGFLVKYPQFAKSPFYISGESYGGQ